MLRERCMHSPSPRSKTQEAETAVLLVHIQVKVLQCNEIGAQSKVECNSEKCWFGGRGNCCNTWQCVVFCWCNGGRSHLEGKAVLLQKAILQVSSRTSCMFQSSESL